MINLEILPCLNCEHFAGVKQPGNIERDEYAGCELSDNGHAEKVFQVSGKTVSCSHQKRIAEDGG